MLFTNTQINTHKMSSFSPREVYTVQTEQNYFQKVHLRELKVQLWVGKHMAKSGISVMQGTSVCSIL